MNMKSPFEGFPKTKQCEKDGKHTFIVRPRVLTPIGAKVADAVTSASLCYWIYALLIAAESQSFTSGWEWALYWASPVLLYPLLLGLWQSVMKTGKIIEMDLDQFRCKKWIGYEKFDRKLPHNFALIKHDRTKVEQMNHEFEVRQAGAKGKVIMKKPYYAESYHLIFEYLGQRNDVLEIYGHKDALAVVTRLKAIDDVLNGYSQGGQGTPMEPKDQWDTGPGDLPDWDDWD